MRYALAILGLLLSQSADASTIYASFTGGAGSSIGDGQILDDTYNNTDPVIDGLMSITPLGGGFVDSTGEMFARSIVDTQNGLDLQIAAAWETSSRFALGDVNAPKATGLGILKAAMPVSSLPGGSGNGRATVHAAKTIRAD